MIIALGTARASKIEALRVAASRIATVDPTWKAIEVMALEVATDAPSMPLTDEDSMLGAKARAEAVERLARRNGSKPDLCVGLEGGFRSVEAGGIRSTFLLGWAYVTDGARSSFGASPAIPVPDFIASRVIEGRIELAQVIDEVANQVDVRSRQGAWGVLSRDLFTRAMSFEVALVSALAPFHNRELYRVGGNGPDALGIAWKDE